MALLAVGCSAQPTAGSSPRPAFNATDTAWILLMIPMAERAQLLTDLAPSRTADPGLAELAAKTGSALRGDLRRLRAVLRLSGVPDTHPHEGHNMPGMVSLGTLEKAAATNGQAFDRILTDALRAGFTQSRLLCAGEQTQGQADEATDLAAAIARSTAEQTSRLDQLRAAQPAPSGDETTVAPGPGPSAARTSVASRTRGVQRAGPPAPKIQNRG
ncbi:DUF305 domain-containing protein [Streptomyces sp. RKAG290]|uniref:DUF305 domain-containing protein n=1 Tax=Streptomyces sp. RKAG290 TaxID=2888348 RepID=UPI0020345272|nr:DUF305 domain-containing protein [Streptomyces sp. RKAG290]MCM2410728.1 DUF305 domain-containing protein [Streptomyces sp. RKAG290]